MLSPGGDILQQRSRFSDFPPPSQLRNEQTHEQTESPRPVKPFFGYSPPPRLRALRNVAGQDSKRAFTFLAASVLALGGSALANSPGGGNGTGPSMNASTSQAVCCTAERTRSRSPCMEARAPKPLWRIDYLRLELAGFKPTPPASVAVYPGNNRNLITWQVVPGAVRYHVYRTTTPGSGYGSVAYGKIGTASGDDHSINSYTDTTAVNGTTHYYAVQSWNPSGGSSANSPDSIGTAPLSSAPTSAPTSAPATPAGFVVNSSGHHSVTLNWNAPSGASYYSVARTTLYPDGVGGYNALRTIVPNDAVKTTTFTDTTPTDGKTYNYSVGPGGSSANSGTVLATPQPPASGGSRRVDGHEESFGCDGG